MGSKASAPQQPGALYVSSAKQAWTSGSFMDKYQLFEKLGVGAFAQVHRTRRREGAEKDYAVKVVDMRNRSDRGRLDPKRKEQVANEILVWEQVKSCPHVVRFYEFFEQDGLGFLVSEKCHRSLLATLEVLPELDELVLGSIILQMLDGIAYLHKVRVVHRDIKPDNILFGGDDGQTVKICDFGLSAILPLGSTSLTSTKVVGTAPFVAPEMLRRRGHDQKVDVWSLGVVVYVLLFGGFPYNPRNYTASGMKAAILDGVSGPSFRAKDKGPRSEEATSFARALLERDAAKRCSSHAALNHAYMVQARRDDMTSSGLPSLKQTLALAKAAGAFELSEDGARRTRSDLDKALEGAAHRWRCRNPGADEVFSPALPNQVSI